MKIYQPLPVRRAKSACRLDTSFSGGEAAGQPDGAIGSGQAFRARRMLRSFLHERGFVQDSVAFFTPDGPPPSPSLKGRGVHVALLIRYPPPFQGGGFTLPC